VILIVLDYSKESPNHFLLIKRCNFKGEGRNWVKTKDDGIALTGKVELFPRIFTKKRSNFEADLMRNGVCGI
jgi:hypothetical protein